MIGIPGVSAKLFQCLSQEKINVILLLKVLQSILSQLPSTKVM
jgi:hypothetical protein